MNFIGICINIGAQQVLLTSRNHKLIVATSTKSSSLYFWIEFIDLLWCTRRYWINSDFYIRSKNKYRRGKSRRRRCDWSVFFCYALCCRPEKLVDSLKKKPCITRYRLGTTSCRKAEETFCQMTSNRAVHHVVTSSVSSTLFERKQAKNLKFLDVEPQKKRAADT